MKKLPKIYQTEFNKKINNNKKSCYVEQDQINLKEDYIQDKESILEEIFSGFGYSYNIPLQIKTKTKLYETSLISRTKKNIITIDNDIIPISEIIHIKKKKN